MTQSLSLTAEKRISDTPANKPPKLPNNKPSGSSFLTLFSLCLAASIAGVGYFGYQEITRLKRSLQEATQELSNVKSQLIQTSGEISQSGKQQSEVKQTTMSRLDTIDSEIRKLWDVSNKRNKQMITNNQKLLENHTTQLTQQKKSLSQQDSELDSTLKRVKILEAKQADDIADMSQQLKAIALINTDLLALSSEITLIKTELSNLSSNAAEIEGTHARTEERLKTIQTLLSKKIQQLEASMRALQQE